MADSFQEKTEKPTSKRLEEARRKGNVAKSIEINSAIGLISGLSLLYLLGGFFYQQTRLIYHEILNGGYMIELTPETIHYYLIQGLGSLGILVLGFMIGIMVIGMAASIMQVGFLFTLEPLQFKFEKINPLKGFKKILFSARTVEELVKNILKLTIVIFIGYQAIMGYREEFIPLQDKDVSQIASFMISAGFKVSFKIAAIFILIAAADFAFQKYQHIKNLMMTKQEVKDEAKQTEGDPKIKSKIRSVQIQMAMKRMMQNVPTADVVITNPTHYAVALKYDVEQMRAPKVVAKGQNLIALRIRDLAEMHDVPIVEDPPLARALYQTVELDQEIPEQFFQAVAEVLAYVYKLKQKTV
ncbi:MAG: flagellar biosynthesis protein FlhB [Calditrichaeota bacterium]|nr:flagellar biosynthesis protein FlhB [Calditrichota bacterium]